MPLYEYECQNGHHVEEIRDYPSRDSESTCTSCGEPLKRVPSAANSTVLGGTPRFYRRTS